MAAAGIPVADVLALFADEALDGGFEGGVGGGEFGEVAEAGAPGCYAGGGGVEDCLGVLVLGTLGGWRVWWF